MTWTKLGDDFTDNLADSGISRSARLLLVELYVYGNRRLLNGEIPLVAVARVTDSTDWQNELDELAAALPNMVALDDSTVRLDWEDQETAEVIEQRRGERRARQERYLERKKRHAAGDHSICDPRFCPALRDASHDASHNPPSDRTPTRTRPDPVPKGQGQGRSAGPDSASATSDRATEAEEAAITSARSLPRNFGATCDCPNGKYVDGECIRCGGEIAA